MSDNEAIAVSRTLLLRSLPVPNPSISISPSAIDRLALAGVKTYAQMLSERGVGYPKGGRLALADPVLLDPFLNNLGLTSGDDTALTLTHSSFGQTTVLTTSGLEVFVDPIVAEITVYLGEREDPLWFELNLASLIDGRVDEAKDILPSDAGGDLHKEAVKLHGMPQAGECFALSVNHENPLRFSANEIAISEIGPYLERIHSEHGFEVTQIDSHSLPDIENEEY